MGIGYYLPNFVGDFFMKKTYDLIIPTNTRKIDLAFKDELSNWETNMTKDFKIRATESDEGIFFQYK